MNEMYSYNTHYMKKTSFFHSSKERIIIALHESEWKENIQTDNMMPETNQIVPAVCWCLFSNSLNLEISRNYFNPTRCNSFEFYTRQ